MTIIHPKDLSKGDRVILKNGWRATVKAKAKGIRILLEVEGLVTEIGDTYTRDLSYRISPEGFLDHILLEEKHKKQFAAIAAQGW